MGDTRVALAALHLQDGGGGHARGGMASAAPCLDVPGLLAAHVTACPLLNHELPQMRDFRVEAEERGGGVPNHARNCAVYT